MKAHTSYRLLFSFALLGLGLPAWSAPSVSGVTIDQITKTSFRIFWNTSDVTSQGRVRFGTTASYGGVTNFPLGAGYDGPDRAWFVTGLTPGTQYFICVEETDTAGTSACNGNGSPVTVQTLPESSTLPDPPQPPQQTIDVSMPVQTGQIRDVSSADCNDPSKGLQAQINAANRGDTVVIPAGMTCTGTYTLPAKSGNGWIVIRTSTPDSRLPTPGDRIQPTDAPLLATVRNNAFHSVYNPPIGGACEAFYTPFGYVSGGGLRKCVGGVWQALSPVASGATVPNTCNVGDWFQRTGVSGAGTYWCVAPNDYQPMYAGSNGGPAPQGSAFLMAPSASYYRLVGLEITVVPKPSSVVALSYPALIYMPPSASHLTVDRCYMHGLEAPVGLRFGITYNGSHLAVVDSYLDHIHWPRDPNNIGTENMGFAFYSSASPGPGRIENNFIGTTGISFFFDQPSAAGTSPADFEVRHNYFFKDDKRRYGGPNSDGYYYYARHHFELKHGKRFLIEGNIFERNFAVTQQGAMMAFTPRSVGSPGSNAIVISDVMIRDNIIRDSPAGILLTGHDTRTLPPLSDPITTQRMMIHNNVFYNINSSLVTVPGQYPQGNFAMPILTFLGPEDLTITHNTFARMVGTTRRVIPFLFQTPNSPGSNFLVRDNAIEWGPSSIGIFEGIGTQHTAALDQSWTRFPNKGYTFDHNVIYGKPSMSGSYPSGNFWAANEAAVGFRGTTPDTMGIGGQGPYAGQASDGTDVGVNLAQLNLATAHTIDGDWSGTRGSGNSGTNAVPALQVRVFPNPWRADRHANPLMTFDGFHGNVTLKIFTLSGHHVRTLRTSAASVDWDLKTDGGQRAASGLYFYLATNESSQARGKFAIIK